MLIEKTKKVTIRKCGNGHYDWSRSRYCTTCGMKIQQVKEDMNITVCDQCGKEVDIFRPLSPVLFCPHCGVLTGEHLKREVKDV